MSVGVTYYLIPTLPCTQLAISNKIESRKRETYEVTRMVLVNVGSVVMLTTGHTTTTWMLSVLSDTTVSSGDMASTILHKCFVSLD